MENAPLRKVTLTAQVNMALCKSLSLLSGDAAQRQRCGRQHCHHISVSGSPPGEPGSGCIKADKRKEEEDKWYLKRVIRGGRLIFIKHAVSVKKNRIISSCIRWNLDLQKKGSEFQCASFKSSSFLCSADLSAHRFIHCMNLR